MSNVQLTYRTETAHRNKPESTQSKPLPTREMWKNDLRYMTTLKNRKTDFGSRISIKDPDRSENVHLHNFCKLKNYPGFISVAKINQLFFVPKPNLSKMS